ncbi:ABC transporter substrate-binding protein [Rhodococcus sp. LB1]|uniref:ABC transporter substrate-binding protein n=1 Tax=Rhodococcus sp. LB1 TaxID=1807499 RepID=UPI00077A162D|nr:ABC transporter substrate-binding protein [Rhodococcus sp. LB1]KXX61905.1 hypothetical protein AZG88_03875 [Rhodococcus sp. LB1]RZK74899.1 MAG: ABC transporter substrate-binding protein [Rhodococcus sp. (in: high G+C Gram-positive bacteria)]
MKRRALLAGACAGLLALVASCANSTELSAANGRTTIKLASSITGSSFLAVTAGIEQGIFDKNGIDVEVIRVKSTAEATAAVASGQANVAAMLTEGVISSRASGSDLKIIANLLTEQQYLLYSKPGIDSIGQFAGRKLATGGPGSGETLAKGLFAAMGVDPSTVAYIASGPLATQVAALSAGQVDGASLVPPYSLAASTEGARKIIEFRDVFPKLTPQVFAASERVLTPNPNEFRAFLSAYKESARWVVDHPDEAVSILMNDSQISYDAAKDAYEFAMPDYSTDGLVDKQGLQTWLDLTDKYGTVHDELPTVDELYDPSYVSNTP